MIVLVVLLNWKKVIRTCVWKWLAVFFVLIAPFIMTIVTGSIQVLRSQYVLPFCSACILMYLTSAEIRMGVLEQLPKIKKGIRVALTVLALWIGLEVRYQQDVALLNEIVSRINELEYSLTENKVVVIGRRVAPLNNSCYAPTDVIGWSYFEMFTDTEPQYYYSTGKVLDFAATQGITMLMPTEDEIQVAKEYAASMPNWPAQGSIDAVDNILVIKLSDV